MELNLPKAQLKIKDKQVWDILRNKYVSLTPEEWVRQHFIHYLINDLGYSKGLMASEKLVKYNGLNKRCDIIFYSKNLSPLVIVECKATTVSLTEDTFYQIAKYNFILNAPVLILTNGLHHIVAFLNHKENKIEFLDKIPSLNEVNQLID